MVNFLSFPLSDLDHDVQNTLLLRTYLSLKTPYVLQSRIISNLRSMRLDSLLVTRLDAMIYAPRLSMLSLIDLSTCTTSFKGKSKER